MNDASVTRTLKGKTIASVKLRSFDDGRGGTAHNPCLIFTDGTQVEFTVEETDVGDYGVDLIIATPLRGTK